VSAGTRATVPFLGLVGQFLFPRGRWVLVCTRHGEMLVPRNTWTAINADIQMERRRSAS